MSQSDIIAPILSYDDINERAEDFLREHKRNEILPVDIEAIAEFDLGLNIFPFPNLPSSLEASASTCDGFRKSMSRRTPTAITSITAKKSRILVTGDLPERNSCLGHCNMKTGRGAAHAGAHLKKTRETPSLKRLALP